MAEFPSVTVDLSEQLEFPGDSYPLTGKVDVTTYTVGDSESWDEIDKGDM